MMFRKASALEAEYLTKLTLESKNYWNYPQEWIKMWTDELTITAEYIEKNTVIVAEEDSNIVGYFSIVEESISHVVELSGNTIVGGFFLDNIFIHPLHIQKGIGHRLIETAFQWCMENGVEKLYTVSDPNARGFYEKMGGVCLGELPSSIEGRCLLFFVFEFMNVLD